MSFANEVDAAYNQAVTDAAPFVPSRAQVEAAMLPIVQRLATTPNAFEYVRASFRGAGSVDAIAVEMLKRAA